MIMRKEMKKSRRLRIAAREKNTGAWVNDARVNEEA